MRISLGCVGCMGDDSAILPIGTDSMGNPIYPSGTTAGQLEASALQYGPTGLPILNTDISVTPSTSGTSIVTNPTSQPIQVGNVTVQPGQSVTIPASSTSSSSNSTGLILMALIFGFFILSQK